VERDCDALPTVCVPLKQTIVTCERGPATHPNPGAMPDRKGLGHGTMAGMSKIR
jgi:hypothetical protein